MRYVNNQLQKEVLKYLYRKKGTGNPILLNSILFKWESRGQEIRSTLQYLVDKNFIWCENHRKYEGVTDQNKHTLHNLKIEAKINPEGEKYYIECYRDVWWNYIKTRFGVALLVISILCNAFLLYNLIIGKQDPQSHQSQIQSQKEETQTHQDKNSDPLTKDSTKQH